MKKIKDIILKEGFRSVVTNGIKSFTVENLASKLSMSKKTIYQHFPKKELLIKRIVSYRMKRLSDEFDQILRNEKDSMIQFIKIREHNIRFAGKFNLKKLIYLKSRYPEIWDIIEEYRLERKNIYVDIFSLAKKQGYLRDSLSPEVCTSLYLNIFNSTFQPDFMLDNDLALDETINHIQIIISNGFFNDRGIKKIEEYHSK